MIRCPRTRRGTIAAEAVETSEPQLAYPKTSSSVRLLYWAVWFVVVPLVLACVLVWALTPPSSIDGPARLGWIQSLVREQPVPVGIVAFTLFEMALWAARQQLPLARHAHPPLRADLPRATARPVRAGARAPRRGRAHPRAATRRRSSASSRRRSASGCSGDLEALRAAMDASAVRRGGVRRGARHAPTARSTSASAAGARARCASTSRRSWWPMAVAFALRAFVIEAFKIPSGSMIPTLMVGDHIFVNKFSYGPAIPYTRLARLDAHAAAPRRRDGLRVPRAPRAGLHQARHRASRATSSRRGTATRHQRVGGAELPRRALVVHRATTRPIRRHEGDLYVEYLGDESYLTFYDRASRRLPRRTRARSSPSRARSG